LEKDLLIIFYNHYLPKISALKTQVSKLIIQIKINYSAICCRNGKGTTTSFIQTKKALIAFGTKTKSWHSPWSMPMKEALFSLLYTYVDPMGTISTW
jgi:hypothetical protein